MDHFRSPVPPDPDARPWARAIKEKVVKITDDPSLSDAEIAAISKWVNAGAPMGNAADMPKPRQFSDLDQWYIFCVSVPLCSRKQFTACAFRPISETKKSRGLTCRQPRKSTSALSAATAISIQVMAIPTSHLPSRSGAISRRARRRPPFGAQVDRPAATPKGLSLNWVQYAERRKPCLNRPAFLWLTAWSLL